jgi:hypothetical protein
MSVGGLHSGFEFSATSIAESSQKENKRASSSIYIFSLFLSPHNITT